MIKVFWRLQLRGFDGSSVRIKDAKTLSVLHSKHTKTRLRNLSHLGEFVAEPLGKDEVLPLANGKILSGGTVRSKNPRI